MGDRPNTKSLLEQKVDELTTLREVNQLITSTLDVNKVLDLILDKAMELLNVQHGILELVNEEIDEVVVQLHKDPRPVPLRQPRLKMGEGITGKAALEKRSIVVHDVTQPPWRSTYREFWPETRSELAVPLLIGEQCIGVLNLEHPEPGYFGQDELALTEGLAAQAAVAIQNARSHEAVRRRNEHLKVLHEISKAITAEASMDQKQVLDRIAEQAVESIRGDIGPKATRSAILLYNETVHKLRLESVYPISALSDLKSKLDKMMPLTGDTDPDKLISIAERAFLTGEPQQTNDARAVSDYPDSNSETNSELDVPLLDGNKAIGVLSLESDQRNAFDEDDTQALQNLAELAVIAIKNAERSGQLARTNAVALMGAWGADVVHDVNREAGAIRRVIFLLRQRDDLSSEVKEYLREVDSYASNLDLPELPEEIPESGRVLEFKDAPLLDELVRAEMQEQAVAYPLVTFQREQSCPDIRVAMHSLWLRRLLRHLIRNAVTAIPADKESRLVTVRTSVEDWMAEIQVEDTGKGVRPEIQSTLFETPVSHKDDPEDDRPGRGLLLVRFLAEQHGGHARLVWTQPGKGSCFAFYVPLAELAGDTSQGYPLRRVTE